MKSSAIARFGVFGLAGSIALFAGAAACRAQAAPAVPAMPWLREGTMLTYQTHAAFVPGQPVTWKQDNEGDWIDPQTGQSYDKITNYGTSEPSIGETVVLAIDGPSVALLHNVFDREQQLGFTDPVMVAPTMDVENLDDNGYWKSPSVLAAEASDASQGKLVENVRWPLGGQLVDAIKIQITSDFYQMEIYDRRTGICLHVASAWKENDKGDTKITRNDLIRERYLTIPWGAEPIPQAAIDTIHMHFVGQIKNGGVYASQPPMPAVIDFNLRQHGRRWIMFDTSATISGLMASTPPYVFGPGEFGGMWIGAQSVGTLRPGQALDIDPDTKMKTYVGAANAQSIEIRSENASSARAYLYSTSTGMQYAWEEYNGPTKTLQIVQRQ